MVDTRSAREATPRGASGRATVVLGVVGTQLDAGRGPSRWERWRPTVALCQQDDLVVDALVLLHDPRHTALAHALADDVALVSPETQVELVSTVLHDAWDFEEVYGTLLDFAKARAAEWDPATCDLLVHITTGTHVVQICLFLLTESRHLPGRLVQTSPKEPDARDGAEHGVRGSYGIIDLDLERYDRLASRARDERAVGEVLLKDGIATKNVHYNQLVARVEEVAARSKAPMLFLGPTGSGKSALARRVYALKKARHGLAGRFVEVNCATIRGDAAMSALFGHAKGAFTGAVAEREGHLARADGGVLFLDEIFELGADEQAMLLRAIEDKTFTPLGSDRERSSNFQLLCGTTRDLFAAARAGAFREDLLARIHLWTFRLPSLRERLEDLAPNVDHETEKVARLLGTRLTWAREAREAYLAFAASPAATWPGNFRDLDASITRLGTLARGGRITRELVAEELERLREAFAGEPARQSQESLVARVVPEAAALDRFDRVQLEDVLAVCRDARSLSDAGRVLFAESRQRKGTSNDADRLRKYLGRFGLDLAAVRAALK